MLLLLTYFLFEVNFSILFVKNKGNIKPLQTVINLCYHAILKWHSTLVKCQFTNLIVILYINYVSVPKKIFYLLYTNKHSI